MTDAILDGESDYLIRIDTLFNEGLSLPSDDIDTPISFTFDEYTIRGNMTDHLNVNSIPGPVVSLKTKTLFEKLNVNNIEYYQLKLRDEFPNGDKEYLIKPKPQIYNNYFIANVAGLVDCVYHERSVLEYFYPPELRNPDEEALTNFSNENNPFANENPNDIDLVTKLVLDETKIDPSLKVFRLFDKPDLLIFHESIVNAIRKDKLSGFVFVPVEEYTDVIKDEEAKENKEPVAVKALTDAEQKEMSKIPEQKEHPSPPKRKFNFFVD